jgi:hypothetical protein
MTDTPEEIPYVIPNPGPCKVFPGQMCISCQLADQEPPVNQLYFRGCFCHTCRAYYAKLQEDGDVS